jgi:hypothetical protein
MLILHRKHSLEFWWGYATSHGHRSQELFYLQTCHVSVLYPSLVVDVCLLLVEDFRTAYDEHNSQGINAAEEEYTPDLFPLIIMYKPKP